MKASRALSIWIIIKSIFSTFAASILLLFHAKFRTYNREYINKIFHQFSTALLKHIKLSYKIVDHHHIKIEPGRHYIVMCNHASHYDIPLSALAIPGSLRMIAKKELFKVPIWGRAMKAGEFISIDREDREQAIKDLETAKEKMKNGVVIWVAPEGTRSRTGQLQPFKKGGFMLAFQTKAIIIPIGIRGSFKILPPKSWQFNIYEEAEVHIGKPIDVAQYKIKDRAKLMHDVENSIRELAALPTREAKHV